jgi:hypothetical protein
MINIAQCGSANHSGIAEQIQSRPRLRLCFVPMTPQRLRYTLRRKTEQLNKKRDAAETHRLRQLATNK